MKIRQKFASIIFLVGIFFMGASSLTYHHYFKMSHTEDDLAAIREDAARFAAHIDKLLVEKTRTAVTLGAAPLFRDLLRQSNARFGGLDPKAREKEIKALNGRWMAIDDLGDPFIQEYLDNPAARHLKRMQEMFPGEYGEIFLTNRYGALVASTAKLTTLAHAHKYWWKGAYDGGRGAIFLDDRGYDDSVEGYVLGLVTPVYEGRDIIGILKCNLNVLGGLSEILSFSESQGLQSLKLARSGGLVIYEKGKKPLEDRVEAPIREKMAENTGGALFIETGGTPRLVGFTPVGITTGMEGYGFGGSSKSIDHHKGNRGEIWFVIESKPPGAAIGSVFLGSEVLFFIGLGLTAVVAMVAFFIGNRMTRPIRALVNATKRFGAGRFDARIPAPWNDEFGELARSFNGMADELRRTTASRRDLEREIVERKRAEEQYRRKSEELAENRDQLRKSEALFRGLFDHMTSGSAIYEVINDGSKGAHYIVKEFNRISLRIEGKTAEEVIGKSLFDLRPTIDDYGLVSAMKGVWETGEPAHFPVKIYQDDRFSNYYENHIFKLPSGEVVTIYDDVTDQKTAERALRENERRLHDLLHAIQAGVAVHAADTGEITMINSTAERLLGMRDKPLIGKNVADPDWNFCDENGGILEPDRYPVNIVRKTKAPLNDYVMGLLPPGRPDPTWVLLNAEPHFDDAGQLVEIIVSSMDISELRKTQEQLRQKERQLVQAQKMESIGVLAGGIAHDFNNILSSIIGFTELALDDVENPAVEDALREVFTAGKRAKDLVGQILAFARQSDEEIRPIRVDAIVKEVLKLIRSSIPTTIDIQQRIGSQSLIMGNATQVHQVLMNLCTNAAQSMEETGGVLDVSLQDVAAHEAGTGPADGNFIKIAVSDTGAGIAPGLLSTIFDPYFTTKTRGSGTGMGLAVVQGIVESYGGRIAVESEPGKGSVFTIYLPVTGKGADPPAGKPADMPRGAERILFVDDEPMIARMGGLVLEKLGYQVTTRTSSVEALELFKSKPHAFDLIFTDMTMPDLTGDQLALELMKIRPDIPIVLCTGYSSRITEERAAEIGIRAFAHKPLLQAELAKAVRDALDGAGPSDGKRHKG